MRAWRRTVASRPWNARKNMVPRNRMPPIPVYRYGDVARDEVLPRVSRVVQGDGRPNPDDDRHQVGHAE